MEVPPVTKEIQVLTDTVRYKDYQFQLFEYFVLAEKGGFHRETEVVCPEQRTTNLFLQLSAALQSNGYLEAPTGQWDRNLSLALKGFQRDNGLPFGELNYETLGFLGITSW